MLGVFFFSFIGGGRGGPILTSLDGYDSSGRYVLCIKWVTAHWNILYRMLVIITKEPMRDINESKRIGV